MEVMLKCIAAMLMLNALVVPAASGNVEGPTPGERAPLPNAGYAFVASTGPGNAIVDVRASDGETMDARVQELADQYVADFLEHRPETAYFTGLEPPTHARFTNNSLDAVAAWRKREDELYAQLSTIAPSGLSRQGWIVWGALKELLEASRQQRVCKAELWQGVNNMFGWHVMLAEIAARQPVDTKQDREAALTRWRTLPEVIDTEIQNLLHGLASGYSAARPVAEAVLLQVDRLLEMPAKTSPFYSMATRANNLAFATELEALVDNEIHAALRRYRDFLRDIYLPKARLRLAVTVLPDGGSCYRAMLRNWTTLDREPREVFELGKKTVASNLASVRDIAMDAFELSDIPAIVAHMQQARDNRFHSEAALLEHSRAIVMNARQKSKAAFTQLPDTPVVVTPIPEYQRGSGRTSHYVPPGSAGEPGEYRIASEFWKTETKGNAEITAVHETWPGHHVQVAGALQRQGAHPILKLTGYSGYTEGWGRYAEQLAEETGMYTVEYARITRRLWPARGMVADPGVHLYGWTEAEAAEYFAAAGRFSLAESKALVLRMAVMPGQLTAYDSGAQVILALREKARRRLGARFDLREFHERVLENGPLPLWQLQDHVEAWILHAAATPESIQEHGTAVGTRGCYRAPCSIR